MNTHPEYYGTFLETAHPVKFLDTVENAIDTKVSIPDSINNILHEEKKAHQIGKYDELKNYLLQ